MAGRGGADARRCNAVARVILTQPEPRVHALADRLRARGHEVLVPGFSRIVERAGDPDVQRMLARLAEFDFAVLVSPSAVHAVAGLVRRWPPTVLCALIGPGSRAALDDAGFDQGPERVLVPSQAPYDGASLTTLPPFDAPAGLRVLVLRGMTGSDDWIDALRARGAHVQVCAAYRHEPIEPAAGALAMLGERPAQELREMQIVVTQTATVARLDEILRQAGIREQVLQMQALAIHPRIVASLQQAGWTRVRQIEPGECALMHALESPSGTTSRDGY